MSSATSAPRPAQARLRLASRDGRLVPSPRRGRLLAAHTERWLHGVWTAATDSRPPPGVALAAVGGLARRDAGPTSDLDLVLLHDGESLDDGALAALAERLWYPVWDAGFPLDHSVRTPAQCREIAETDVAATVGLLDLRLVAGDGRVVETTKARLLSRWRFGVRGWLGQLETDLYERGRRSGDAAHLLEPDLRESRGGLRDVLVLRALTATWLADRPHAPVDRAYARLLDARDALQVVSGRRGARLVQADQQAVAALLGLGSADEALRSVSDAARTISHALDATLRRARQAVTPPARRRTRGPSVRLLGYGVAEADGEVVLGRGARPDADPVLPLRVAAAAA
ncbi:MAG TPA: [protein-PII] uridylyltransferase, partial [Streptosporangiales bacterium]